MKNRKNLKKEIKKSFDVIYQEVIFYNAFTKNPNTELGEKILDEALSAEGELIRRVSVNEGKEVKGRRKMYFNKLQEDLKKQIELITKKIAELPH